MLTRIGACGAMGGLEIEIGLEDDVTAAAADPAFV